MENLKICLTTYIYGDKYQEYIPLLVYSINKAYPHYTIMLFLHGAINENVKTILEESGLDKNVIFKEYHFHDCPNMSPLKSMALRWVLWDDSFMTYDYLYIVDIDMFYIKEPEPLHVQHIQHMRLTGLPFDNMRRIYRSDNHSFFSILRRIKYAGLRSIVNYWMNSEPEYRLTGLHFIDVKKYYSVFTYDLIKKYCADIYDNRWFEYVMSPDNEILLAMICKQLGFSIEKLAIQSDFVTSLDFKNFTRPEFRPHHGIHMGIFRNSIEQIQENSLLRSILESEVYKYYISVYKEKMLQDSLLTNIIDSSSDNIKDLFVRMNEYYQLLK